MLLRTQHTAGDCQRVSLVLGRTYAVPTMWQSILDAAKNASSSDTSCVRLVANAAGGLPHPLALRLRGKFACAPAWHGLACSSGSLLWSDLAVTGPACAL